MDQYSQSFRCSQSQAGGDIGFDTQVTLAENNGESWLASIESGLAGSGDPHLVFYIETY